MEYAPRYWEDVREGEELPNLYYDLSLTRLIAYIRATGAWDYVHFDRDYARVVGARDAFIQTYHVSGLFGRLLTDWGGPECELRSLEFQMRTQCCAGDMLTVSGVVGRKYRGPDGEYLLDIEDLVISHSDAVRADTATATLQLPSREGGPVGAQRPVRDLPEPVVNEDTPAFGRDLIGKAFPGMPEPSRPLTEQEVYLWCVALEDWNPHYWDSAYAANSRFGRLVAPHASMFFGPDTDGIMGLGVERPGARIPEAIRKGLTGLELQKALRDDFVAVYNPCTLDGFPEVAVSNARAEFFRPMRVGDIASTEQKILSVSPLKKTRLGEGHFVKWIKILTNQDGELIRTMEMDGLYYRV
jgi:acyl dehydratase